MRGITWPSGWPKSTNESSPDEIPPHHPERPRSEQPLPRAPVCAGPRTGRHRCARGAHAQGLVRAAPPLAHGRGLRPGPGAEAHRGSIPARHAAAQGPAASVRPGRRDHDRRRSGEAIAAPAVALPAHGASLRLSDGRQRVSGRAGPTLGGPHGRHAHRGRPRTLPNRPSRAGPRALHPGMDRQPEHLALLGGHRPGHRRPSPRTSPAPAPGRVRRVPPPRPNAGDRDALG